MQKFADFEAEKVSLPTMTGRTGSADLDCESAMLLRSVILPLFEQSASWDSLIDRLKAKGYRLGFRDGALCLTDRSTGTRVCGLRFLGLTLRDLIQRLGRPLVVAHPGNRANGDLLRSPSSQLTSH